MDHGATEIGMDPAASYRRARRHGPRSSEVLVEQVLGAEHSDAELIAALTTAAISFWGEGWREEVSGMAKGIVRVAVSRDPIGLEEVLHNALADTVRRNA